MLGKRSWRDVDLSRSQRLEVQINLKDREINTLREQLTRLTSATRMAETNMVAQEAMIKSLQLKQETEKAAKLKAMVALSERAKNLEACSTERKKLEEDLDGCKHERGL
jgi:chromosome segregation ATPase